MLQIAHRDSPASMSPLEEVTISTVAPMMAVFNNLVLFDQHVPQNTLSSIVAPQEYVEDLQDTIDAGKERAAARQAV